MRILSLMTTLAVVLTPMVAQAEELSDSPQFRYRAHRTRGISRPTHRSVERATRNYRSEQATIRRNFARQLRKIEQARDVITPEYSRQLSPEFSTDQQGHVPYYWFRTRRHVRHLHWVNEFRQQREVQRGEGPMVEQTEEEAEEVEVEVEVEVESEEQ